MSQVEPLPDASSQTKSFEDVEKASISSKAQSTWSKASPESLHPRNLSRRGHILKSLLAPGSAFLIVIAAIIAIIIGLIISSTTSNIPDGAVKLVRLPGDLWLKALKAIVLPMIMASMIVAMKAIRELPGQGARMLGYALGYYLSTTLIAVVIGIVLANIMLIPNITPIDNDAFFKSSNEDGDPSGGNELTTVDQVVNVFSQFIPENVVGAMAKDELLAVIVIAASIGLLLPSEKQREQQPDLERGEDDDIDAVESRASQNALAKLGSVIYLLALEVESITTRMVRGIILLAPVGVFFMLLAAVMAVDFGTLMKYAGILIGTQIVGYAMHWSLVYPTIYWFIVHKSPLEVVPKLFPAIVTAFGTSSSAATFPVTNKCAQTLDVTKSVRQFTLPLGATVNMDGTTLCFPLYVLWIAFSTGQPVDFGGQIMIVMTSVLASIGTAPIPSAGLVLIVMIAKGVGVEVGGMIGLIAAFDWLVDRIGTAVNVSGDLYGALIVDHLIKKREGGDLPRSDAVAKEDIQPDDTSHANERDEAKVSYIEPDDPKKEKPLQTLNRWMFGRSN